MKSTKKILIIGIMIALLSTNTSILNNSMVFADEPNVTTGNNNGNNDDNGGVSDDLADWMNEHNNGDATNDVITNGDGDKAIAIVDKKYDDKVNQLISLALYDCEKDSKDSLFNLDMNKATEIWNNSSLVNQYIDKYVQELDANGGEFSSETQNKLNSFFGQANSVFVDKLKIDDKFTQKSLEQYGKIVMEKDEAINGAYKALGLTDDIPDEIKEVLLQFNKDKVSEYYKNLSIQELNDLKFSDAAYAISLDTTDTTKKLMENVGDDWKVIAKFIKNNDIDNEQKLNQMIIELEQDRQKILDMYKEIDPDTGKPKHLIPIQEGLIYNNAVTDWFNKFMGKSGRVREDDYLDFHINGQLGKLPKHSDSGKKLNYEFSKDFYDLLKAYNQKYGIKFKLDISNIDTSPIDFKWLHSGDLKVINPDGLNTRVRSYISQVRYKITRKDGEK